MIKPTLNARSAIAASAVVLASSPAYAGLPDPVREMVEAAMASGDPAIVDAVIGVAKQTNPDDAPELDSLRVEFLAQQTLDDSGARAGDEQELAEESAESDHGEAGAEELAQSDGFFDNWSGRGEIGASRSTGNTNNLGVSVGLDLNRESERWQHRFHASADLRRNNGSTTREEYVVSYEPRFQLDEAFYVYALAQWEQDRFQGFASRVSTSGGFGYRMIDEDNMHLTMQAGPAWRRTDYTLGPASEHFSAMSALNFDWTIAENLTLTETVNAYFDSSTTTITSTTGIEAAINGSLRARFSYVIDHDTGAPAGTVKTDTLSRITLVYGF